MLFFISSTNKTNGHDITEILLKVVFNTNINFQMLICFQNNKFNEILDNDLWHGINIPIKFVSYGSHSVQTRGPRVPTMVVNLMLLFQAAT